MRKVLLGGLIVLNVALTIAVATTLFHLPQAHGQTLGLSGNYLMVNGQILGVPNDAVYLVDLTNRVLSCLIYDRTTQEVSLVATRDLVRDLGEEQALRPGVMRRPPARAR